MGAAAQRHGDAHPLRRPRRVTSRRHVLERFLNAYPERYRIVADAFSYDGLGLRVSHHYSRDFMTFAGDVIANGTAHASFNMGALQVGGDYGDVRTYPSEHAFEEEIRWILLRSRGSSRMRSE